MNISISKIRNKYESEKDAKKDRNNKFYWNFILHWFSSTHLTEKLLHYRLQKEFAEILKVLLLQKNKIVELVIIRILRNYDTSFILPKKRTKVFYFHVVYIMTLLIKKKLQLLPTCYNRIKMHTLGFLVILDSC